MPVRTDDVFVVTFPRSGTTWTQELVWLIANDIDYERAAQIPLVTRFPFLEFSILFDPNLTKKIEGEHEGDEERLKVIRQSGSSAVECLRAAPSPRFIKSHLPLSLLPPRLLDAKVVFVARDPRDVAVSFYHHNRLIRCHGYEGDFKTYWNYFIQDLILYSPVHEFNKEAWNLRHHPNLLFLFYEDLAKDLPGTIRKLANILNKELSQEQIERLCAHVHIDNFRNNKSVNEEPFTQLGIIKPGEESFIRKGKIGGWREYFDEDMSRQAAQWMEENLRDTDLRYPTA